MPSFFYRDPTSSGPFSKRNPNLCNASRSFIPSRGDFLKFTGVDASSIVRKRRLRSGAFPTPPSCSPNDSRGSLELRPSDIKWRFPPGVFPGAPYRVPLRGTAGFVLGGMGYRVCLHKPSMLSLLAPGGMQPTRDCENAGPTVSTNARMSKEFTVRKSVRRS